MKEQNSLFNVIGLNKNDKSAIQKFAEKSNVLLKSLLYYNESSILPPSDELERMAEVLGINRFQIMIGMGIYDQELKDLLSKKASEIGSFISVARPKAKISHKAVFKTELGQLYQGDCISLMLSMNSNSVDLIFADPPFNLSKLYPSNIDDNISTYEYINWTEKWLTQCIRILKPGGSLFLWNLPKWNTYFSEFLNHRLNFKNWITADIKFSLPIQSKLYPSHYSLLYYCKEDKPSTFTPDRLKMDTCPHCYRELRDYGGYKDKMNPNGINMSDVWYDIPPVRHSKYKKRKDANELSIKLLDRIIEMASNKGDTIFDPFGGSGTSYLVAEIKERRWIGIEIGPCDTIIDRIGDISEERNHLNSYRENYNQLFPPKTKKERIKRNLWTAETFENFLVK